MTTTDPSRPFGTIEDRFYPVPTAHFRSPARSTWSRVPCRFRAESRTVSHPDNQTGRGGPRSPRRPAAPPILHLGPSILHQIPICNPQSVRPSYPPCCSTGRSLMLRPPSERLRRSLHRRQSAWDRSALREAIVEGIQRRPWAPRIRLVLRNVEHPDPLGKAKLRNDGEDA